MKWAEDALKVIEATREERLCLKPPILSEEESQKILHKYHPDYLGMQRNVQVGPNANVGKFPHELANLLESDSQLPSDFEPSVNIETDLLIIGGGGAGASAALALEGAGLFWRQLPGSGAAMPRGSLSAPRSTRVFPGE